MISLLECKLFTIFFCEINCKTKTYQGIFPFMSYELQRVRAVCSIIVLRVVGLLYVQVLSRSGSVDQQHHFIDLLGLNVNGGEGTSGVIHGSEKNCVKLRGLPWSSRPEDVISFFGNLGEEIAPQGVHMVLNAMVRQDVF